MLLFGARLIALAIGAAPAAGPTVRWSAPASCPDTATATTSIASGLDASTALEVDVTIVQAPPGYIARLAILAPSGQTTRELSSPSCATLVDTIALIAAAAQGEVPAPGLEPDPEPPMIPEAAATPTTAEQQGLERQRAAGFAPLRASDERRTQDRQSEQAPPKTLRRVGPHVRPFGILGWGMTPVVDAGGGAAVGLTAGRFRVEALGYLVAPTRATVAALPTAQARVWAWSFGARACGVVWASRNERLALPLCGGALGGQVIGTPAGFGLQAEAPQRQLWWAAHAGPAFVVKLAPWFSLLADLGLVVPLRRPGFSVQGSPDEVHRVAPAAVAGTLGAEFHFPRRIFTRTGMQ